MLERISHIKLILFYFLAILFIACNLYLLTVKETRDLILLPIGFIVVAMALFRLDVLFRLVIFLTPLSIPLTTFYPDSVVNMSLPSEPVLFGLLGIFVLRLLLENDFDRKVWHHPVTYSIGIYLGWMLLTSFTSTMPLVSLKAFLAAAWFISAAYFMATQYLKRGFSSIRELWLLFIAAMVIVIILTIRKHIGYGLWNKQIAYKVPQPFFNDHTVYGAVIAMMIPYVIAFASDRGSKMKIRLLFALLFPVFLSGLIFSYSRASWLSIAIAAVVWIIMKLRIRFTHLLLTAVTIVVILFTFWTQILLKLETNKTDSSSNMMKHVESMTNITSDASNVERLNRWYCALEMFKEKPVLGWGPNTYQFKYAPFQIREFRTIISTNSGDWGNAHSEYLGALVSSGLPGLLAFLVMIVLILYTGIRLYSRTKDARTRLLTMAAVLSLITYFVHSFLNNFLDMDNAAVPFWMSFALIVVLDIHERQSLPQQKRPA
ncbi:hypothetical protein PbJCM13498_14100 [Prolixibacter bellariivorans]|uniref:O-antigen ligase-related domain-containing protein n=1 Tax=Prolixibacter bellariivorans TaxID=314319 RepID=A0A5M4AYL1_9BACT|nr:hypothetical protein PbJCM13498_14100 [Prolixibacter bellariivorans]